MQEQEQELFTLTTSRRKWPYTSSPRLPSAATCRPSRAAAIIKLQLPPTSHDSLAGGRCIKLRSMLSLFTSAGGGICVYSQPLVVTRSA